MVQYSVGRGVIRDVLSLLRDEGLIQRLQGTVTFVVMPALSPATSTSSTPIGRRRTPRACSGRSSRCNACRRQPPLVCALDAAGSNAVYHERVIYLDGQPVTLHTGWMSVEVGAPMLSLGREL